MERHTVFLGFSYSRKRRKHLTMIIGSGIFLLWSLKNFIQKARHPILISRLHWLYRKHKLFLLFPKGGKCSHSFPSDGPTPMKAKQYLKS